MNKRKTQTKTTRKMGKVDYNNERVQTTSPDASLSSLAVEMIKNPENQGRIIITNSDVFNLKEEDEPKDDKR
jgi:hypothetical protein